MRPMKRILMAAIVCLGVWAPGTGGAADDEGSVTVGYQAIYNPWKVLIANGTFAGNTGRSIEWRRFDSGAQVINALALGKIDIAMAGSSPIAAGRTGRLLHLSPITQQVLSSAVDVVDHLLESLAKPEFLLDEAKLQVPVADDREDMHGARPSRMRTVLVVGVGGHHR